MRLLLVNDDGISAPGLAAMERAVADWGETLVVAPDRHLSGCGHTVTANRPLVCTELGPNRYMLDGTPADCTRLALRQLSSQIEWVFSGINEGGNLGADVYMSGTVAAVREAALLGSPGIAVSHYIKRELPLDWERAARWAGRVMRDLLTRPLARGEFWNVNLPHLPPEAPDPEAIFCPLDCNPLLVRYETTPDGWVYRGNYHQRPRDTGTDVDVCFAGHIAVTRLRLAH